MSRRLEVNPTDGSADIKLNRQQVWVGLGRKAENAVLYVEAIANCVVVQQQPEQLIREVVLHGETLQELI